MTDATLTELNRRIAAIRETIRELIEQAAAYSGAADDERTAERIADQEAKLAALLKKRDALLAIPADLKLHVASALGRRPFFLLAVATVPHSQGAFVLTQYGWLWLSQRSDAKSPGASAPGLLFMRGDHATVSGVRFFSMEPVATDDVFGAGLGASPLAVRNPGPEKVMKPRMISLCRGFFISPMARALGFGRRPLKETERLLRP